MERTEEKRKGSKRKWWENGENKGEEERGENRKQEE